MKTIPYSQAVSEFSAAMTDYSRRLLEHEKLSDSLNLERFTRVPYLTTRNFMSHVNLVVDSSRSFLTHPDDSYSLHRLRMKHIGFRYCIMITSKIQYEFDAWFNETETKYDTFKTTRSKLYSQTKKVRTGDDLDELPPPELVTDGYNFALALSDYLSSRVKLNPLIEAMEIHGRSFD